MDQGQSIQPRVHLIGSPITVAELLVVDKKFLYSNPLEAIETAFFFFTALNIKYPAAAEQVWNIFSELVFNVATNIKGTARTLLNDLKK